MRCFISVFVNLLGQVCGAWTSRAKFVRRVRLLAAALMLLYPTYTHAEDWKGIRPLVSTEKDVVKILGECKQWYPDRSCRYDNVTISYANRSCVEGGEYNVPIGTVVRIVMDFYVKKNPDGSINRTTRRFEEIDFREKLALADLTDKDFEIEIPDGKEYHHYKSLKRGIYLETLGNSISRARYTAPEKVAEKLKCSEWTT